MKIGIITWFTGPNYGTNLQAIALQYFLHQQGNDVSIINYDVAPPTVKNCGRNIIEKIKNQPHKYLTKYALYKYKAQILNRNKKMVSEIQKNCNFTDRIQSEEELIENCNKFDLLICGSDQIWNPNWYNKFYYADYPEILTPRISYAPSLGVNNIPKDKLREIITGLKKFDAISVREENGADILTPYLEEKPSVVLDPTFLLSEDDWASIFPLKNDHESNDYVLAFFLAENKQHFRATQDFAKRHNLKYIIVPYVGISYLQKGEKLAETSSGDLLNLIRNAKYVITDSFHITVFSLIHKKQFYTFQRFKEDAYSSQNVRITNLLKLVHLENRMIPYEMTSIMDLEDINYIEKSSIMKREISKSMEFLLTSIKQVENKRIKN
ncbi:polysaccharide pyruvyl transferase family protein [Streptococcus thermophilus]|uniref:polysaccharide pyruvyl transferase family protein n=1 Tax=Streptococcus thermophilus TaxID=1308 RepID=UPI0022FF12B4|nr:polysaccharide pyruvyl transferase family protein [Streptococcus thermophilus]MDA5538616.1 polysaccharide pyruvyl transferase family protein [Streptococcus thermophilus]MDA5553043.1 polysaccharide pyruvyl transferase family protein [Streptococcus thermophilus]WCL59801.1 polysaccharide pyruvyl transferase family protein [Streptococcus thermophilus]